MKMKLNQDAGVEVLLVEDNPCDAELIRHAMENSDLPVHLTVSPDGLNAMNYLRIKDGPLPHIILLDLGLPSKNGWEVLSELKLDAKLSPIPVVILTGSEGQEISMRATFSEADDYLSKPKDLMGVSVLSQYLEKNWFSKFRPKPQPE